MSIQVNDPRLTPHGAIRDLPNPTGAPRTRRRFRFGLRTLLLLPVIVTALLLLAFPKLFTGLIARAEGKTQHQ